VKMRELLWRVCSSIFLICWIPNLVSKVLDYPMKINFLMNKVKNRGDILFTYCLIGTSMGVSLSKR
jgi:hypothetical protein